MSETVSKLDRRREQNRRAQANLRKRQQQRVEYLEQQVIWLKTHNQPQDFAAGELPLQVVEHHPLDHAFSQTCPDFGGTYDGFQYIPMDVPSCSLDGAALIEDGSTNFPGILTPFNHSLVTPSQPSSITPTPPVVPGIQRNTGEVRFQLPTDDEQHYCAFDALTSNAALLNISPESFLSTHSCSPFYSPFKSIDSIAASIAHLPHEFYPTMPQLSYPHQPWIDCIPLPDLRSRIIFAVSHRPPFLDSLDLWHDVLSDGLSCGADPQNAALWIMSEDFMTRWQMLLTLDLDNLKQMCLTTNPPVQVISLPESLHIET